MRALALALLLIGGASLAGGGQAVSPSKQNRTHGQGPLQPVFQFAPTSGAGMGTACAGTMPTGSRGETLTWGGRSSPATCLKTVGAAPQVIAPGDLVTLSANQPRVMYGDDGATWLRPLFEGPTINVALWSEAADNPVWNLAFSGILTPTVTANAAQGPCGAASSTCGLAERLQLPATTVAGVTYSFIFQSVSTQNPGSGSWFVRGNGTTGTIGLALFGPGGWRDLSCSYVSTGYTRCKNENVGDITAGVSAIGIGNLSGIAVTGAADRTAQDVFIWGSDLENRQAVSSYVSSAGTQGTRSNEPPMYATLSSPISGTACIAASFVAPVLGHAYGDGVAGLSNSATPDGGPGLGIAYNLTGNKAPPYSAVTPVAMGCYRQAADVPTYTADTLGLGGTQPYSGRVACAISGADGGFFYGQLPPFYATATRPFALAPANVVTIGGSSTTSPPLNGLVGPVVVDSTPSKCFSPYWTTRIAWVGDSITYGFPDIQTSPAAQLTQLINSPTNTTVVVDEGTNGFRALDCSARFMSEVQGRGYKTVIWSCAVNDMAQDATGAQTAAWVEAALTLALADHSKVIVSGVIPWKGSGSWTSGRQTQTVSYNALISAWAAANGATYVDMGSMGGQGGDPDALLAVNDSGDKIHLSATGKANFAQKIQAANP